MVFAPLTSDAPLYHWPRATVGLIAANVVAFAAVRSGLGGSEEVVLTQVGLVLGNGLHPLQWVTSNFVHLSFLHLAGNMMFLWAFGLIVEGKLGWRKFLAVYFAAGVLECAAGQVCSAGACRTRSSRSAGRIPSTSASRTASWWTSR